METIDLPLARMTVELSPQRDRVRLRRHGSVLLNPEREWRPVARSGRHILAAAAPWTRRGGGSKLPATVTYAFGVLPGAATEVEVVFRRSLRLVPDRERRVNPVMVDVVWAAEVPGRWQEVVLIWSDGLERHAVALPGGRWHRRTVRGRLRHRPDGPGTQGP